MATKRVERLGRIEVMPETKFYFTDPTWQTWKIFDGEVETLREELTNSEAESYGFFKIDFCQGDKVIADQFHAWLDQRRGELTQRPNKLKSGNNSRDTTGRGHKKRKCEDYLKALGGLRHYDSGEALGRLRR